VSEAIFRKDDVPASAALGAQLAVLLLYGATLFLSATLLFAIQPMFAKVALPLLGGSAGVWNTAMVFFQATLLLAYGYAHFGTRLGGARRQVPLHVLVLALGFLALPVAGMAWTPPTEGTPVFWLIAFLAASIGLPVFAISATAPLLQRWFAATDHPAAKDPYFLYGASNLGSVIALLGYPVLLERLLTLKQQAQLWSAGYILLAALIGGCALVLWWRPAVPATRADSEPAAAAPLIWRQRGLWVLLAFVPSSLMLGVTTHISTDIAATPLFWVVPLTLYLLTFVLVFARRPLLRHAWMLRLQPFVLIPLALTIDYLPAVFWLGLALHLLVFFVTAMVCHGELARRRPASAQLTEFYVWMSVGGVLGGMFNGLLAPIVFNGVYEYPLVLALACLLRPRKESAGAAFLWKDLIIPAVLLAVLSLPMVEPARLGTVGVVIFYVVLGCLLLHAADRPLRFALVFAVAIFGAAGMSHNFRWLEQERSFFGVNRIQLDGSREFTLLVHGNTVHGAEHRDPARRDEPLTYYSKEGPVGQLFALLTQRGGIDRVGLTGLGIGTTLCYRQPGQHWTIYEIDPVVVRFARDVRYFHYLEDCAGDTPILLGDARISLAKAPPGQFDLLIFDAFSSDSVPVHLVTREALALYLDKLGAHGVIAFHISNRHINLQPVLANLAADAGLVAWRQGHRTTAAMRKQDYKMDSNWVVMARRADDAGALQSDSRWHRLTPQPGLRLWTDDYSNILGAMR
jgi:spermidine synthase